MFIAIAVVVGFVADRIFGDPVYRLHPARIMGGFTAYLIVTQENISKIIAAFTSGDSVQHFTKLVSNSDVAEQGYNLSVSTYVEQEDKREVVDITALNTEIERIVARGDELRREISAIIAEIEGGSM